MSNGAAHDRSSVVLMMLAVVLTVAAALAVASAWAQERTNSSMGMEEAQPIGWPRSVEYRLDSLYFDELRGPVRATSHVYRAASYDEWTDEELSTSVKESPLCQVAHAGEFWEAEGGCDETFGHRGPLDGEGVSPNPYVAPVDTDRLEGIASGPLTPAESRLARQLKIRPDDLHVSEQTWLQTCDEVGFLNCAAEGDDRLTRLRRIVTHLPSGVRLLDLDYFGGVALTHFEVRAIGRGREYRPPAGAVEASERRRS